MNAPERLDQLLALTREPMPASRKIHLTGSHPDLRVPLREITLSQGERVSVYDTSGPYTDPGAEIDVRRGLPALRAGWLDARGDTEHYAARPMQARDDGLRTGDPDTLAALRAQAAGL